jgi:hypothetical protein
MIIWGFVAFLFIPIQSDNPHPSCHIYYQLDLEILFHLLKKRFIKPHIAKRNALSEVAEAQASLEKENARGEIVCLPWKRLGPGK